MEKSTNNRDVKRSNRIDTLRAILEAGRVSQPDRVKPITRA